MGLAPEYDGSVRIKDLNSVQQVRDDLQLASDLAGGNTEKISVGQLLSDVTLTGEASGAIASFSDALDASIKSCIAAITPTQDLHGYDRPWAGGAGRNLLPMTVDGIKAIANQGTWTGNVFVPTAQPSLSIELKTDSDNNVIGIRISGSITSNYSFYLPGLDTANGVSYTISGSASGNLFIYDVTASSTTTITGDGTQHDIVIRCIIGGSPFDATCYPMIRLSTDTDPTFVPYSNICPITGHDEVTTHVRGFNLWDEEFQANFFINASTGVKGAGTYCGNKNLLRVISNTTYCITFPSPTAGDVFVYEYGKNGNYLRTRAPGSTKTFVTYTSSADAYFIYFAKNQSTTGYGTTYNNDICINIFDQAKNGTYEPYNPNSVTYIIDLGTTVIGGTLDLVSGVLTVDKTSADLGDLIWQVEQSNGRFLHGSLEPPAKGAASGSVAANALSDSYTIASSDAAYAGSVDMAISISPAGALRINDSRFSDATALKTSLANAYLVYELATPYTVQLTPTQVRSLLGTNNVWSDTGEMDSVVYVRNINAVIGDILQRLEALEPSRSARSVETPAEEEEEAPAEK